MSKGVNKVILIGFLGQDPEVKFMPNGNAVANFTVATSESWTDQQGQKQERTEWHRIVIYRKLAEIAGQYLRKGSKVYLEGKLQTREWQDQQGQKRYTTEIVCHEMQMLDSKQDGASYLGDQARAQQSQQPAQQQRTAARPQQGAPRQAAPQPQRAPQQGGYSYDAARNNPPPQPTYNEPPMDFDDDIPF